MSQRFQETERPELGQAAVTHLGLLGHALLSLLLSPLPQRWRAGLEDRYGLDAGIASLPSALLQLALGFACGAIGFMSWMRSLLDGVVSASQSAKEPLEVAMPAMAMISLNPFLPFIYVLTSPIGFASLVVMMGGFYRCISQGIHSRPAADPTLQVIDRLLVRRRKALARKRREADKGPPAPDRIVLGTEDTSWHLRIISREEYDWPVSGGVVIDDVLHRLMAESETRDTGGHVRQVYDLRRHETAEVIRTVRRYLPAQPPLRKR